MTSASELPRAARPFADFARHIRRFGFPVVGEQAIAFMQGVTLLGPRSMEDIRQAALATLREEILHDPDGFWRHPVGQLLDGRRLPSLEQLSKSRH